MDTLFPFGFPVPTAFYLTLYVLTLVVHVVCMNYVLAGAAYLTVARWLRGNSADDDPCVRLLADWLPLMLSVAITAGIAPLLFLQILYRPQFYAANLLLFHRWMAILPVLIVGFYGLYVVRRPLSLARWPLLRRVLTTIVWACFVFIGWSWTENHLLSLQREAVWTDEYARGGLIYWSAEFPPRLATWLCGAFPTLAVWLLWQMRWTGTAVTPADTRRVAQLALGTLTAALACALAYAFALNAADRGVLWSPLSGPWLGLAVAGVGVQVLSYARILQAASTSGGWLQVATAGLLSTTLGVAVAREGLRLSRLDLGPLLPQHADAYAVGGFTAFAVFLVENSVLIAWCVRLTRRARDAVV